MKVKSRPFLASAEETDWKITRVDYEGAWRRYAAAMEEKRSFRKKLVNRSATIQTAQRAINRLKKIWASVFQPDSRSVSKAEKDKRNLGLYGVNYCQEDPEFTNAWSTTRRILECLKRGASSIGGELFVFTIPGRRDVDKKEVRIGPNRELICWDEMPGFDRLTGILDELEVGYVDLLPGFKELASDDRNRLFHRSDKHWNEYGHKVASEVVYSALRESGVLRDALLPGDDNRPIHRITTLTEKRGP